MGHLVLNWQVANCKAATDAAWRERGAKAGLPDMPLIEETSTAIEL